MQFRIIPAVSLRESRTSLSFGFNIFLFVLVLVFCLFFLPSGVISTTVTHIWVLYGFRRLFHTFNVACQQWALYPSLGRVSLLSLRVTCIINTVDSSLLGEILSSSQLCLRLSILELGGKFDSYHSG